MKKIFSFLLFGAMILGFASCGLSSKCASKNTSENGIENGHEYIDLGLSVKWATCNVGATKPEEYGDYFSWGETKPKSSYDWSNYKHGSADDSLTKYCTDTLYGRVDNKTTLDLADDAARANWGGAWRMPTLDEQKELLNNCIWTWTARNGVNGYEVKAKNGNSIFLPAAGCRNNLSIYSVGTDGYIWSSSLDAGTSQNDAFYLYICTDGHDWNNYRYRYCGLSVRAVCSSR